MLGFQGDDESLNCSVNLSLALGVFLSRSWRECFSERRERERGGLRQRYGVVSKTEIEELQGEFTSTSLSLSLSVDLCCFS